MVQLTGKYIRTSEAKYEDFLNRLGVGKDYKREESQIDILYYDNQNNQNS